VREDQSDQPLKCGFAGLTLDVYLWKSKYILENWQLAIRNWKLELEIGPITHAF
jgi:hypothetical protein